MEEIWRRLVVYSSVIYLILDRSGFLSFERIAVCFEIYWLEVFSNLRQDAFYWEAAFRLGDLDLIECRKECKALACEVKGFILKSVPNKSCIFFLSVQSSLFGEVGCSIVRDLR